MSALTMAGNLFRAIKNDNKSVLADYLKGGGVPNKIVSEDENLLYLAIDQDKLWAVKLLLKYKPAIENSDMEGQTPLMKSVQKAQSSIVMALLDAGADPNNALSNGGNTALHSAVNLSRHDLIKPLISRGAKTPIINGKSVWTVAKRERAFVELLNNGVDPKLLDNVGRNALHWAADKGFPRVIKKLIQRYKINPNSGDNYGSTPLMMAAGKLKTEACRTLLILGGDAEISNAIGMDAADLTTSSLYVNGKNEQADILTMLREATAKARYKALKGKLAEGKRLGSPKPSKVKF